MVWPSWRRKVVSEALSRAPAKRKGLGASTANETQRAMGVAEVEMRMYLSGRAAKASRIRVLNAAQVSASAG